MIAVAADLRAQVLLVPVGEEEVVIQFVLALKPAVEGLVHHDKTHFVGQFEQLRRGRIVAGADGVAAHVLQISNWRCKARRLMAVPRAPRSW